MSAPIIYHLTIERFRGIDELSWSPAKGMNVFSVAAMSVKLQSLKPSDSF